MSAFKVFLSHRYKSPEVNLFFFDLFSNMKIAELQFEVDGWNSEKRTLEKKLRSTEYVPFATFNNDVDALVQRVVELANENTSTQ